RRQVVFPMHALGNVGDAEPVGDAETRMLAKLLPREFVGANIKAAPSLRERDEAGHRHRPLRHALKLVPDFYVLDIARCGAADFFGLVYCESPGQIFARVMHRRFLLDLGVLGASLARRIALSAEAPAIALGDQFAALIEELASVDLLDRAAGEARLMLDQ